MTNQQAFIDTWSSAFSDLRPGDRTITNALRTLAQHPRVSTFDRSGPAWIDNLLRGLLQQRLIVEVKEAYPWHRFELTDAGRAALE